MSRGSDLIPPDRLPPQSKEAEQNVIGSLIRDPDCVDDVLAVVGPEDFYYDAHRKILFAVLDLHDAGKPVDLVSVATALRDARPGREALEDVGGTEYLAGLLDAAPTAANAAYYAGIVRDRATRRRLIHAATEVLRDAHDGIGTAEDLLAQAEQRLADVEGGGSAHRTGELVELAGVGREVLRDLDDRAAGRPRPDPFVRSGFAALDNLIGGFRPGRLYVVAARPSVGKSALGLGFLLNAARAAADAGVPGLIFSLEMDRRELAERALAACSGVALNRVAGPALVTGDQAERLAALSGGFGAPILVNDRSDLTAARVASATRRAVRRHRVGLVVLDYLQLLVPENPRDPRHLQVGQDSRRLKQLARQCAVPVIAMCQLNREVESRGDQRPKLSDLRDSGEIEQNADAVLLLYRDGEACRESGRQSIGCVLAKQRGGPTGEFTLAFSRPVVRFENPAGGYL